MNAIVLQKQEVDWLQIINLALKRQDWGKSYNLYMNGRTIIRASLISFNFEKNFANFRINIDYMKDGEMSVGSLYANCINVEYYLENFKVDQFKDYILRRILTLITNIRRQNTKALAEKLYKNLHTPYYTMKEDIVKYAQIAGVKETYDDMLNIKDETIRDTVLTDFSYTLHNLIEEDYEFKVDEYMENNTYINSELDEIYDSINIELNIQ